MSNRTFIALLPLLLSMGFHAPHASVSNTAKEGLDGLPQSIRSRVVDLLDVTASVKVPCSRILSEKVDHLKPIPQSMWLICARSELRGASLRLAATLAFDGLDSIPWEEDEFGLPARVFWQREAGRDWQFWVLPSGPGLALIVLGLESEQTVTSRPSPTGENEEDNLTGQEVSSYGTCFAVRPDGRVLTANHVVEGARSIRVRFVSGEFIEAELERSERAIDLAVLRVQLSTPDFLPLAGSMEARLGMTVFTVGFPATIVLGDQPKFSEGTISSLTGPIDDAVLMQISVPIQPGSSGGPLVNARGTVVGIVTSSAAILPFLSATGSLPQNVNWAIKADYARVLYEPPTAPVPAATREDAISRTTKAVCIVEATR